MNAEADTTFAKFFPYLIVKRKTDNHGNRFKSVEKEKTIFNRPHVGMKLLLCERTSESCTDTTLNSCFSIENIIKGLERNFRRGNLINISEINLNKNNNKNKNNDNNNDNSSINVKNKKDMIIRGEEYSLHKELSMHHRSQNTTQYLVQSTQAVQKRNISQNRELRENRTFSSDLFRFISCENDGILVRTNAVSMLAFSLSTLAEAVAGVCVYVCT